jgi:hypothetical protein
VDIYVHPNGFLQTTRAIIIFQKVADQVQNLHLVSVVPGHLVWHVIDQFQLGWNGVLHGLVKVLGVESGCEQVTVTDEQQDWQVGLVR